MIRKFPIIRPTVGYADIWRSLIRDHVSGCRDIAAFMAVSTGNRFVYPLDSGLAAFYLILSCLKIRSERKEVVIPAYTAGSLVVAIKKAGLKPVLCDISLEDFNLDRKRLLEVISGNTLAVVPVHMFGIPFCDIRGLSTSLPAEVSLVEDCCQAQGSKVDELAVGNFGKTSFFSFNRGKNFSTFGGGCVATNDQLLAGQIEESLKGLSRPGAWAECFLSLKMLLSILATKPLIYGLAFPVLQNFKENSPPDDLTVNNLSAIQCCLAAILSYSRQRAFQLRNFNGTYLARGLASVPGLRLAAVPSNIYPVYNRFPVLFEDIGMLEKKIKELWIAGFEASRMYLQPLHKMFELGYKPEEFSQANFFAEHVLTLPVYPGLEGKELDKIIEVIRK
jgi:perosamine synthetase